jgi:hypothetical protein
MFDGFLPDKGGGEGKPIPAEQLAQMERALQVDPEKVLKALSKKFPIFDEAKELARIHAFIERKWSPFDQEQINAARFAALSPTEREGAEELLGLGLGWELPDVLAAMAEIRKAARMLRKGDPDAATAYAEAAGAALDRGVRGVQP